MIWQKLRDRVCIRWLLRYFELYGDDSSLNNKDKVIIQVMLKHEQYQKHMMDQHRDFVDQESFYEIWKVVNQTAILRYPWFMQHLLRNRSTKKTEKYVSYCTNVEGRASYARTNNT